MEGINIKFKSKIDWWFHLLVFVLFFLPIFKLAYVFLVLPQNDNNFFYLILGGSFLLVSLIFILPMYFFTYYVLDDKQLKVRSGLCCNKKIPYEKITDVSETRDPWSSPALSLDRIEIQYSTGLGVVLISPENKQEFLRELEKRRN